MITVKQFANDTAEKYNTLSEYQQNMQQLESLKDKDKRMKNVSHKSHLFISRIKHLTLELFHFAENLSASEDNQRAWVNHQRAEGKYRANTAENQPWQLEWHPKDTEDPDHVFARQGESLADCAEPGHGPHSLTTQLFQSLKSKSLKYTHYSIIIDIAFLFKIFIHFWSSKLIYKYKLLIYWNSRRQLVGKEMHRVMRFGYEINDYFQTRRRKKKQRLFNSK